MTISKCIVLIFSIIFFIANLFFSSLTFSAECAAVFPDGVSNSLSSGSITFQNQSKIIGSPDNVLETLNLRDNSNALTCDTVDCLSSNSPAEEINFNSFINNQPSINLGFRETRTVSPGTYNQMSLNSEAVITMEPGQYYFNGNVNIGFRSEIVISAPGTVFILTSGQINTNQSILNRAAGDKYLAIYTRGNVNLGFRTEVNATVYSHQNVGFGGGQVSFTGAITARGHITIANRSVINFDSSFIENTDFDGLCTNTPVSTLPEPIGEWRLDEFTWRGASDEVLDSSGNGLHGRAVSNNGLPSTLNTNPVVAGSPGTCYYGDFDQTSDGYVEISDPGTNSILDLDDEYTVAVWVYALGYPNSDLATIISKDENFEFHFNTAGQIFWWWGGGVRSLTSNSVVSLNAWHHIAITYKSGEQTIYIDGVADATTNSTQGITVNNDSLFFGTDLVILARRLNGFLDEVKIYDKALSAVQINTIKGEVRDCGTAPVLASFTVDVGANASVCSPQEVTITAYDSVGDVFTEYIGTVNLSTSTISTSQNHGNWEASNTASDAYGNLNAIGSDAGTADYTFNLMGDDEGSVRLNLSNQHAESLTITASDISASASGVSSTVTFSENAFVIETIDSLGNDVIAGRDHQFRASVVRKDPATGECGVATDYNNTSSKVWVSRSVNDPSIHSPLNNAPVLNNTNNSAAITLRDNSGSAELLDFPFIAGVADFNLSTSDVGEYSLEFLDDSTLFSDLDILGSSSVYTIRPFGFYVDVAGNPKANNATDNVFAKAGDNFTVTVSAVAWSSNDDTNDDGIPDYHDGLNPGTSSANNNPNNYADLSNNNLLPSFGHEPTPVEVVLSSSLLLPVGGRDPGLSSGAASNTDGRIISGFSNGQGSTSSVYFEEVGVIDMFASIKSNNYLGASSAQTIKSQSRSGYVGRFTPAFFTFSTSSVTQACEVGVSYSYMGEKFSSAGTFDAQNSRNTITQNYEGTFAKLTASSGVLDNGLFNLGAIDSLAPTLLSSRLELENIELITVDGVSDFNLDLRLARGSLPTNSAPDGPFAQTELGVNIVDGDGITSTGFNLDSNNDLTDDMIKLGDTAFRFGRLRLDSAFGPETAKLNVTFHTEYWSGVQWIQNLDDSCSTIPLSAIGYPSGTINESGNRTVNVGNGTSTGMYGILQASDIVFSSGDAEHFFTAPGPGNIGEFSVGIDLTNIPWLRYDWNQDGDYNNDSQVPEANYSFGRYRGHDRLIYWQEVFQ